MVNRIVLCHNDAVSRANYLQNLTLPDNYMGDYTVMGLVVDCYDDAVALLKLSGYQLEQIDGCNELVIDSPNQLPIIQNILAAEEIYCEYSDIADTLYQA